MPTSAWQRVAHQLVAIMTEGITFGDDQASALLHSLGLPSDTIDPELVIETVLDMKQVLLGPQYALYRFFDPYTALLYVGITNNLQRRVADHRSQQLWWREVASITIQKFGSREELAAAEARVIAEEKPRYNIVGSDPDIRRAYERRKQVHAAVARARLTRQQRRPYA